MATFAPGYRLAFDRDGSAVYRYNSDGSPNHPAESTWDSINNEADDGIAINNGKLSVVFPVSLNVVGIYPAVSPYMDSTGSNQNNRDISVSPDTTNGIDGTWTVVASDTTAAWRRHVMDTYRTGIIAVSEPNVKGVQWHQKTTGTETVRAMHIYVSTQETFLKFWDPSLDQELAHGHLDWETFYAGEAETRQFRVKNTRATTAQGCVVDVLTHTNTANTSYHTFSLDGTNFSRPLDIGDIAAGAISPVVYVRYAPPSTATVTTYASQVSVVPTSWA